MGNYAQYLNRMTESTSKTTKQLIPLYAAMLLANVEKPRILEVGIGSSVVGKMLRQTIPNAFLVGIDINDENIEKATQMELYDRCFVQDFMTYEDEPFDMIIFSSVIHEICAYTDKNYRYHGAKTVDVVFEQTSKLCAPDGYVIIRDGMAEDEDQRKQFDTYYFEHTEPMCQFIKFLNEFKCYIQSEFDFDKIDMRVLRREKMEPYFTVMCPRWLMREFLCTATWGKESWEREIKERFCLVDDATMKYALQTNGFKVLNALFTSEQYNEHFKHLITFPNEQNIIGLYIAKKE